MNYLGKHIKLMGVYLVLGLKKSHEYKTQFFLNIVTHSVLMIVWFLFWDLLFSQVNTIAHWTLPMLILMVGFFELSDAIWQAGYFTMGVSDQLLEGKLDRWLSRPINPLFGLLMQHFDADFIPPFIIATTIITYTTITYFSFHLLKFGIALLICIIAVQILHTVTVTIGCLGFWFGKTRSLVSLYRGFLVAKSYPMDLLGRFWRGIVTFFFPGIFFATYPALAIGLWTVKQGLFALGLELAVFLITLIILYITWSEGVKRYESMGG